MNCPYCKESIKAEALVCRYCHRDVFPPGRLYEELRKLQKTVDAQSETLHLLSTEFTRISRRAPKQSDLAGTKLLTEPPDQITAQRRTALMTAVTVLVPATIEVLSYAYMRAHGFFSMLVFVLLALIPFPFGVWMAKVTPGRHLARYVGLGLLIGIVGFMGTVFLYWADIGKIELRLINEPAELLALAVLILGPGLIFIAGSVIGDWWEGFGPRRSSEVARRAARLLTPDDVDKNLREDRVTKLASVFSALTPLLGLLGTLATAYFTYLAAVNQKASEGRDAKAPQSAVHSTR